MCLLPKGSEEGKEIQLPERETRPSVLGSTQQHVRLWDSDLVRRLTERTHPDVLENPERVMDRPPQ